MVVGTQSYACTVHGPITFPGSHPRADHKFGLDEFIKRLIDTEAVQRLRWIRQNGLAHFVFNTMEHSRFSHSLGVAFVARRMMDRILTNSGLDPADEIYWEWKYETVAAALLHDIGHGPFSHTLEEILKVIHPKGNEFKHEQMTLKLIKEKTQVHEVLESCKPGMAQRVARFFTKEEVASYEDKNSRDGKSSEHNDDQESGAWRYRIVSSQLDADRLDYILRDAQMAGLKGAGFDLSRILQHLYVRPQNQRYFILDRKAVEALESALLVNDQLYRAVYYHRKVRAATAMMKTLLLRVADLVKEEKDRNRLFNRRDNHPLLELIEKGGLIKWEIYLNLTENHIWALIEQWKEDEDPIVKDYASRLWYRKLHCAVEINGHDDGRQKEEGALKELKTSDIAQKIESLATSQKPLGEYLRKYYILSDTSRRKSYKEGDSIYLGNQKKEDDKPTALEFESSSRIIHMLREQHKIEYVIYPDIQSETISNSSESANLKDDSVSQEFRTVEANEGSDVMKKSSL